jgi:N-acetylmuramoyl-L-alanine amidase
MQLSDAEIREILIRRKREKKRRLRQRRRRTLIILLLLIVLIFVLVKVIGHGGKGSGKDKKSAGAAASGENRGIIFIDPGHGGMDSGSDDGNERYEKDDTLKLGLAVRDKLEALGFTVVMSRTEDELVDRTERGKMANKAGAQLFVSIHRNQSDSGGQGVEGFIPKEDDKNSRLLGENIMHFLGKAGFAERTIRAGTLGDPNDDYEENAATEMPSVLIEVGFLSSDDDNYRFDNNLDQNAKAIADAINYTFMLLHEPDAAAEYSKMMSQTDEACNTALTATGEALSGLNAIQSRAADGTIEGIDPEA